MLLDLAPQAGDPDVDAAVERIVAALVRQVQQAVAGQHAVGVVEEGLDQAELHRGEGNLGAVLLEHPARLPVDQAPAEPDGLAGNGFGAGRLSGCRPGTCSHPAQDAPDPGQKLAGVEGFGDVIVGAHLQSDDPVDGFPGRRQDDDGDIAPVPKLARQHQTIFAGHPQVQNDQGDRTPPGPGVQDFAGGDDAADRADLELLLAQVLRDQVAHLLLVIDDEDMSLVHHNRSLATVKLVA
ncbi:hypothetical protein N825_24280 [Skermanella stibiiresistens SB22]|uniref:Uncharacterized protein n=1 Tax=Skermanella stibiiresistens SB22 TaxID=1385369 RepID=W9HCS1_9PROT|nr:hypothetical protein N825_24280 [Skermanella stibiiresistens SB22]